jgi:hypothetical protein
MTVNLAVTLTLILVLFALAMCCWWASFDWVTVSEPAYRPVRRRRDDEESQSQQSPWRMERTAVPVIFVGAR